MGLRVSIIVTETYDFIFPLCRIRVRILGVESQRRIIVDLGYLVTLSITL